MTREAGCPSRETLAALLLGKLTPEQEGDVNRHVEACAACEARTQQLEQESDPLVAALRQPPTLTRPPAGAAAVDGPAAPPAADPPFPLDGYRILEEVGRGGMGVVYRAYQHRLNRVVAVKMILTGQMAGTEARVRFLMEGALLARLSHPNFVQVYEVGTVEPAPGTVQPYLVLEYIEGGNLKARLAGRPLPFREAARWALVLARAVAEAHAQGILHRDLKPANVLMARDGTLKITDFGLAKELDTQASLTPTGHMIGTPSYMAPEQARARAHVGPAADVYALGAILYEMLTGRPPFTGEAPMDVLLQVLENTPPPVSRLRAGIPRDLETICLKCLEKEPRARYARAADLADDLECWLENRSIRARPAGRLERAVKWARRHPLPTALLAFLTLSLVLGSAASTYFGVTAVNRAHEAQEALAKEAAARRLAEKATEAERWERYVAEIAAASSALELQNVGPARRALEAAPERYRNWEWRHLHSQLDGARFVLRGHLDGARLASFSPDGKWLTSSSVSSEPEVRIWDVATGQVVRRLRAPVKGLWHATFSPAERRLVTAGDRLRLWDAATGALLWEASEARRADWPVWSADGRLVAAAEGGRLSVRDAATGKEVFTTEAEPSVGLCLFSPDGKRFAVREGHTVVVWEPATGRRLLVLRGHAAHVGALAFSPDGRRIATGSAFPENQVRLWDAASGAPLGVGSGHANEVSVLAFSADGRRLASASMDQTVRVWDGLTAAPRQTLVGHTNFVRDLAFSPDGKFLVSASEDQTLRLWDPDRGQPVAVLRGHTGRAVALAWGSRSAVLASTSADRTVRLWDVQAIARNGVLRGHENFVYDVAFRPDGGEVASAAWDGTIRLWDPTACRETACLRHAKTDVVAAVAYSPDGRKLAAVVRQKGVWLWDLAARKGAALWKGAAGAWDGDTRLAFQPGGKLLAWGSLQGPVRLWDLASGAEVDALVRHEDPIKDVAFRPDGKQLASASKDGTIYLWDMATRQPTAILFGPRQIYRLAYSADGRLLAAASGTREVGLWQVDPPGQLGVLPLGSAVYGIAFNGDGTRLACACADGTISLWDVGRQREVAELRGHGAYVHAVQFSPDGTRLVSGSGDHTVRVWGTLAGQDRAGAAPR